MYEAHQRDMAPAEEHAATVEITHSECRGRLWPRDAPAEIGMEQEADAEDRVVERHKGTGTMIDVIDTEIDVIVQQCHSNQQVDCSRQYQCRTV